MIFFCIYIEMIKNVIKNKKVHDMFKISHTVVAFQWNTEY